MTAHVVILAQAPATTRTAAGFRRVSCGTGMDGQWQQPSRAGHAVGPRLCVSLA
jgi:hypothetical protein